MESFLDVLEVRRRQLSFASATLLARLVWERRWGASAVGNFLDVLKVRRRQLPFASATLLARLVWERRWGRFATLIACLILCYNVISSFMKEGL